MTSRMLFQLPAVVLLVFVLALTILATPSFAADHLDAPLVSINPTADITDTYLFRSPENPANTTMVMAIRLRPPGSSGGLFGTDVEYELQIYNDPDEDVDISYNFNFSNRTDGGQDVALISNNQTATGKVGDIIDLGNGGKLTTGVFDDPFFFDLPGFLNDRNFTGNDFFADSDVAAIVLELPTDFFGDTNTVIGFGGVTRRNGQQVDRMGRPVINTALIPMGRKDEFNQGDPFDDRDAFGADVRAKIQEFSGDVDYSAFLSDVLLPDLTTYVLGDSGGFPNGRRLQDDVIDLSLALITGAGILPNATADSGQQLAAAISPISDGVDANDVPFLNTFPYLAPAHGIVIPEPSSAALALLAAMLLGCGTVSHLPVNWRRAWGPAKSRNLR